MTTEKRRKTPEWQIIAARDEPRYVRDGTQITIEMILRAVGREMRRRKTLALKAKEVTR